MNSEPSRYPHLDDGDLFLLAFPPSGEPEPLPPHLSDCASCAGRFAEWERAAREIAGRPEASAADFERAVMARVRAVPRPAARRARAWRAGLAAAAALAGAFWVGSRTASRPVAAPAASESAMAPGDLADDALLRDVARLVDGEEPAPWKRMAPLPGNREGRS
jgi:anti-sigma factor RsiW